MIAEGMYGADIACYCGIHATIWEEINKHYRYILKLLDRLDFSMGLYGTVYIIKK